MSSAELVDVLLLLLLLAPVAKGSCTKRDGPNMCSNWADCCEQQQQMSKLLALA